MPFLANAQEFQEAKATSCFTRDRCRAECDRKHPEDEAAFGRCASSCERNHPCDDNLDESEQLFTDARARVDCPGTTACKIRCNNLHGEDDKANRQCVRENCTDRRVCRP